jgi:DNA repair protein RecO (recombination protein O)
MPSQRTPAIIISVKDYGEADRLVTFLTPRRGRLTGIAKHARQSKKRFANCLEPLSRVTLFLSARPRGDLEFLEKGESVRSFPALRRDLARLGAAALLAELASEMASPPEATACIFTALETALTLLDKGAPPASLLPGFLLHLLRLGGYGLSLHYCLACGQEPQPPVAVSLPRGGVLCGACARGVTGPLVSLNPGAWKLLRLAQNLPPEKLGRLRFPPAQRVQSLRLVHAFIRHHLSRDLKAWSFWDKVACPPERETSSKAVR